MFQKLSTLLTLSLLALGCVQTAGPAQVAVAGDNNTRPLALVEADADGALSLATDLALSAELLRIQVENELSVDIDAVTAQIDIDADSLRALIGDLFTEVDLLTSAGVCAAGECTDLVVALDAAADFTDLSVDLADAVQAAFSACNDAVTALEDAGLEDAAQDVLLACEEAALAVEEAAQEIEDAAAEIEAELADFEAELEAELQALEEELAAQQAALEDELAALEEELNDADEETQAALEEARDEVEAALQEVEEALADAEEEIAEAQAEADSWLDECLFSAEGCDADDLCWIDDSCEDEEEPTEEGA